MATNLSIDPDLLDRALEVSGERTKKAAVTRALEEFIARREQKRLLELFGSLEWDPGFDYKQERDRGGTGGGSGGGTGGGTQGETRGGTRGRL
ncbi:MAG: type II toxin-antitoxin system VapB family antitoxin [Polyangia bacterium]|jgi:hypothetical protein|nr:type II toxin-antitoxin system VapB family antitoxin [Polyangia bacterium]